MCAKQHCIESKLGICLIENIVNPLMRGSTLLPKSLLIIADRKFEVKNFLHAGVGIISRNGKIFRAQTKNPSFRRVNCKSNFDTPPEPGQCKTFIVYET